MTNEQEALDLIVGHVWYVRRRPGSRRLEFIPTHYCDGQAFTPDELESMGEVGYSMELHPELLG